MKKVLLIALAAVAACMVSCSKEPSKIIENGFVGKTVENPFKYVAYSYDCLIDSNIDLYFGMNKEWTTYIDLMLPMQDAGATFDFSKPGIAREEMWEYEMNFEMGDYYYLYSASHGPYVDGKGTCKVEYLDGPFKFSTSESGGITATLKEGVTSKDAKFKVDLNYSDELLEFKIADTFTAAGLYGESELEPTETKLKSSFKIKDLEFGRAQYYSEAITQYDEVGLRFPTSEHFGVELWADNDRFGEAIDLSKEDNGYYFVGFYSEYEGSLNYLYIGCYSPYYENTTGSMQIDYIDGPYEQVDGEYKLKEGHKEDESAKFKVSLDCQTIFGNFRINKEYTTDAIFFAD